MDVGLIQPSLLAYSLRHRWYARIGILLLAFGAAVAGLLSPFFQKVFVDQLLGTVSLVQDWSVLNWIKSTEPPFVIFLAFVCTLLAQGFGLLANYFGIREGVILQKEFSEKLYRKMLSIRSDAMGSTTVGEVVSIYATDIAGATAIIDQAIPMGAGIIFPLVFAPLVIYWLCGIPLWATLMVMATIVTMNVILATRQSRFFFRFKQLAAERTGMVNEWVQNIRLLRILGWTEKYESKIFRKRDEETRNRVAMVTNGQIMGTFGSSISFVINLIGVSSLIFLRGQAVSPGELFALLWIFGVFLARPFRQIPWILTFSLDSLTSLRRLERFFERPSDLLEGAFTDETETVLSQKRTSQQQGIEQPGIPLSVRGLSLKINGKQLLSDVSFDVLPGELVAVVGEVGCGKSLLVLSLVAETGAQFDHFTLGDVDGRSLDPNSRRRYFAFVPQEGFVMSATLRDNVAFRYGVAEQHDDSVVRSLHLAQFRLESEHVSDGLNTEIGERGVNLSGGQRQRVSLARAHHFERPIVLLDDCLSAVDVDTEKQLIRDLIDGAWAKKTRILVTHRLTVLERVDRILFMEDGKIVESGKFDELLVSSARMREFVATVRRSEQAAQQSSPSRAMTSEADAEPVAANTLVMSNVAEVAEAASQSAERTEAGDVEAESVS